MYTQFLIQYNTKIKAMCEKMSKGSKEALTVSIVSYVTHVGRVKSSSINSIGLSCFYVKGVKRSSKWSYTSVLITSLIFNGFSIPKSFGKLRLSPFQSYQMLCMLKGSKVILTFDLSTCFNICSI